MKITTVSADTVCMALSASVAAFAEIPSFNALIVGQACLFLYTIQLHSVQLLLLKVCKTNLHIHMYHHQF